MLIRGLHNRPAFAIFCPTITIFLSAPSGLIRCCRFIVLAPQTLKSRARQPRCKCRMYMTQTLRHTLQIHHLRRLEILAASMTRTKGMSCIKTVAATRLS